MHTNKKYWFISEFFWPNGNSTGQIITRIVDQFTVDYEAFIITSGNIGVEERNKNTHTKRINDFSSLNKNNIFLRLFKLLFISTKMAFQVLISVKKDDIIVTVTNPAFILLFLSWIKKVKKFKLIILVHDVFPENLLVIKFFSLNSFLYKALKKIFDSAYNRADLLITCGRDMQNTIKKKVKKTEKVLFIPNFADTDSLYQIQKKENPIINDLYLENKLVIFFTGNIGRMQNIESLINTMELLQDDPEIVFLFIGNGALVTKIVEYTKNASNVIYLPEMPRSDSLIFLNAGDIGLSTLLPNIMGTGVPSKTYSYMATGKPVIAVMDTDTEIALMIQEEGNGWVVEPDNPKKLAELITEIKTDPSLIQKKGELSYKLSKTKYAIENIISQYINVILSL